MTRRPLAAPALFPAIAAAITVSLLAFLYAGSPATAADSPTGLPSTERKLPFIRHWQVYDDAAGLPHDDIRTIRRDGDRLWVGTSGGLACLHKGRWQKWATADGLPSPVVSSIDVDAPTGDVWIGTLGGGLARLSAGRIDTFDQINSGLAGNLVFDVLVDAGVVWAATNGGISRFRPATSEWDLFLERRADREGIAVNLLALHEGVLFAAAWRGAVYRLHTDNDQWREVSRGDDHSPAGTARERLDAESSLGLLASGDALYSAERGRLLRIDAGKNWTSHDLPFARENRPWIYDIAAADASLLVATEAGLLVLDAAEPDRWIYHPGSDRLPPAVPVSAPTRMVRGTPLPRPGPVYCAEVDAAGIVWLGTPYGLIKGTAAGKTEDASAPATPVSLPLPPATPSPSPPSPASIQPPAGFDGIAIGILGPRARTIPFPGGPADSGPGPDLSDLLAVQLAVERANAAAPPRTAVTLVTWTHPFLRYGWGLPEDDFGAFVAREGICGMVGCLSPRQKAAELACLRTRLPLINAAPPDVLAAWPVEPHPWMQPHWGNRPADIHRLVAHLARKHEAKRCVVVRSGDWTGQLHADWWKAAAVDAGLKVHEIVWPGAREYGKGAGTIQDESRGEESNEGGAKVQAGEKAGTMQDESRGVPPPNDPVSPRHGAAGWHGQAPRGTSEACPCMASAPRPNRSAITHHPTCPGVVVDAIEQFEPDLILTWTDVQATGELVVAIRHAGLTQPIAVSSAFFEATSTSAPPQASGGHSPSQPPSGSQSVPRQAWSGHPPAPPPSDPSVPRQVWSGHPPARPPSDPSVPRQVWSGHPPARPPSSHSSAPPEASSGPHDRGQPPPTPRAAEPASPSLGPLWTVLDRPTADAAFARAYSERHVVGRRPTPPDANARRSFAATARLIEAARAAAGDRSATRRALEQLTPDPPDTPPAPTSAAVMQQGKWEKVSL